MESFKYLTDIEAEYANAIVADGCDLPQAIDQLEKTNLREEFKIRIIRAVYALTLQEAISALKMTRE